jgi:hypothetical protein
MTGIVFPLPLFLSPLLNNDLSPPGLQMPFLNQFRDLGGRKVLRNFIRFRHAIVVPSSAIPSALCLDSDLTSWIHLKTFQVGDTLKQPLVDQREVAQNVYLHAASH